MLSKEAVEDFEKDDRLAKEICRQSADAICNILDILINDTKFIGCQHIMNARVFNLMASYLLAKSMATLKSLGVSDDVVKETGKKCAHYASGMVNHAVKMAADDKKKH